MMTLFSRLLPRFSIVQWLTHIIGWIPLITLVFDYSSGNLTRNPIQAATQRTGQAAVIFLLLSLACTPLIQYTGFRAAAKLRRPLGLYSFFYAGGHLLLFLWADYGWRFDLIIQEIVEKRYLWVGIPALLILFALAITSTRKAMRAMGKRWKPLHRLVYLAGILVVLHMAWVSKGDLFTLSGDIVKPLLAGIALILLLGMRLPIVKNTFQRFKKTLQSERTNPAKDEGGEN